MTMRCPIVAIDAGLRAGGPLALCWVQLVPLQTQVSLAYSSPDV